MKVHSTDWCVPITFISMSILQQYQKDILVIILIVAFRVFPPFILYVGLYLARKLRRYITMLYAYYAYNTFYVGLLAAILFYSLSFESVLQLLRNLLTDSTLWATFQAQISLCNVVISDNVIDLSLIREFDLESPLN